ncbi:MAG: imidazole glycerol phosphate synthase subunit HisF [Nanoarchaeota archaeon]|nr:imidazole glycerol phosphate synthase subunit HisF [Nanoarchaeota archaeon]
MQYKRLIICLDIDDGKVVKCVKYKNPKIAGNPVTLAKKYYEQGVDELIFVDITASIEKRKLMLDLVRKVSKEIFIPFTVGGGINTIDDMGEILAAGADKVAICTAAVKNPELITRGAKKFGSQAIVVSIDVKKNTEKDNWEVYIMGGRENTGLDAIEFAKICDKLGAGEILLNSLDRDGTNKGYELDLLKMISEAVSIPVIASSGGGTPRQILEAFTKGRADAALAASMFHYNRYTVENVKNYLKNKGVEIR